MSPARADGGDEPLDLRGEVCPYTSVRTRLRLEALPIGAVLAVRVDHAPATRSVPRALADWGQEVLDVAPLPDGGWLIRVRKRVP